MSALYIWLWSVFCFTSETECIIIKSYTTLLTENTSSVKNHLSLPEKDKYIVKICEGYKVWVEVKKFKTTSEGQKYKTENWGSPQKKQQKNKLPEGLNLRMLCSLYMLIWRRSSNKSVQRVNWFYYIKFNVCVCVIERLHTILMELTGRIPIWISRERIKPIMICWTLC